MENLEQYLYLQNILNYLRKIYKKSDYEKATKVLINKNIDIRNYEKINDRLILISNKLINDTNSTSTNDKLFPLSSIFKLLKNENTNYKYIKLGLDTIPCPIDTESSELILDKESLKNKILDIHQENNWENKYVNSLLQLSEDFLSYVTDSENSCISIADKIKFSTCICSCVYKYTKMDNLDFYSETSYDINQKSLILFSFGFSGIQKFIYTVAGEKALKCLRARSFYLDMLLEHISDRIINELGLPISNILYCGGGRANLLLPNTNQAEKLIKSSIENINKWLLENFDISLYITYSCEKLTPKELFDSNKNSSDIYTKSNSDMKSYRYNADQIKYLNNHQNSKDDGRECRICSKSGDLNGDNVCSFCSNFIEISKYLLKSDCSLVVTKNKYKFNEYKPYLRFPTLNGKDCFSYFLTDVELSKVDKNNIIQIYSRKYKNYAREIHIASYGYEIDGELATFDELSGKSEGIKRIGIMRADIDNLGTTFIKGFNSKNSIMYKAALSKQLTLFFKKYINNILIGSLSEKPEKRKVVIVYSGGDDVFIAGSWNDIIKSAMEIKSYFDKFTAGALTFSAGIGIFETKYPIYAMADETEKLEDSAKEINGKNAVCLFGPNIVRKDGKYQSEYVHRYKWDDFKEKVVNEKLNTIKNYFDKTKSLSNANGNSFLYRLKQYIEEAENDKINIARFVYLLSKMQPNSNDKEIRELYSEFSSSIYKWILNETERQQLLTAITIYIYLNRGVN